MAHALAAAGPVMAEGAQGIPEALVRGSGCDASPCDATGVGRPPAEELFP
jgi:hypothetical protein